VLENGKNIVAASATVFAGSGMAVVVKAGALKPDISTPEAYKKALLAAKAIAYSDPAAGGASGVFFAKTLDKMGIAEVMKGRTVHPPPSGNSAELVVVGKADLAIQQTPEVLSGKGIELVGAPPGDLDNVTVYAAGIALDAQDRAAAKKLIAFLKTSQAQAVFKVRGLKPM
jgi:molybdate transport system substrate-binding protein